MTYWVIVCIFCGDILVRRINNSKVYGLGNATSANLAARRNELLEEARRHQSEFVADQGTPEQSPSISVASRKSVCRCQTC